MHDDQTPTTPPHPGAATELEGDTSARLTELCPGHRIGRYVVREVVGEGGFALVCRAEQTEPVRRDVGLKVIKLGMDTKQVIARFAAERQALAVMDHPNVAKVYDAGVTETGRPYFVMEYVAGEHITEYADRHRLSTAQRLELFVQACAAVQHAHQKGIIHRDIKPSNVLVAIKDDRPLVKVIDLGVAKAISYKLTEHTVYTEHGQLIGTPEYMSPEQAEMGALDIDTRTDIYSLGVMLYELLSGTLPFDAASLRSAGFGEIQRIIREEEPPRPSTRLSTLRDESTNVARRRATDTRGLVRTVRGDLDWITMKAMEKDRTRRYETANGLAADIRRHLADEPVVAGPPSASYRLQKFVRRHRVGVAAGIVVAVVMIAATVVSTLFATSETRQRRLTAEALADVQCVAEFQRDVLHTMDPHAYGHSILLDIRQRYRAALENDELSPASIEEAMEDLDGRLGQINFADVGRVTIEQNVLRSAGEAINRSFEDRPLIAARLRHMVGMMYVNAGDFEAAEGQLQLALNTRRRLLGAEHEQTIATTIEFYEMQRRQGDFGTAESGLRKTLELCERVFGPEHPQAIDALDELGAAVYEQGRFKESEQYRLRLLKLRRKMLGDTALLTLETLVELAGIYVRLNRMEEAEALCKEAVALRRQILGDEHLSTLAALRMLSGVHREQGRYDEAEAIDKEVLAVRMRVLGEEDLDTVLAIESLGFTYYLQGRLDAAGSEWAKTLDVRQRVLGREHPDTLWSVSNMAFVAHSQGHYEQAVALHRRAFNSRRRVLREEHPLTIRSKIGLARSFIDWGRIEEAAKLYRDRAGNDGGSEREEDDQRLQSFVTLGLALAEHATTYTGAGEFGSAEGHLLESFEVLGAVLEPNDERLRAAVSRLIDLYDEWGKPDKAAEWRAKLDAGG